MLIFVYAFRINYHTTTPKFQTVTWPADARAFFADYPNGYQNDLGTQAQICFLQHYRAFALIPQIPTQQKSWPPCWYSRQKSLIKFLFNWNTNMAAVTSCANALLWHYFMALYTDLRNSFHRLCSQCCKYIRMILVYYYTLLERDRCLLVNIRWYLKQNNDFIKFSKT